MSCSSPVFGPPLRRARRAVRTHAGGALALAASLTAPLTLGEASADQLVECSPSGIFCRSMGTEAIFEYDLTFSAGAEYDISTYDLALLPGSANLIADTVIWVLNHTSGQVVAIDDDGNTATGPGSGDFWDRDSRVTFTPTTTFRGRVVIASRSVFDYGVMSVSLLRDGQEQILAPWLRIDVPFGGYSHITDVRAGDRIYLGAWSSYWAPQEHYHNTMYIFEWSANQCQSNCGRFQAAAGPLPAGPVRHVDGLSLITATNDHSTTRILAGGFVPHRSVWTRLMHARVHVDDGGRWSGAAHADRDGDGLTWELESALGTCDDTSGPSAHCTLCEDGFPSNCPATICRCFGDRHPKLPGATPPYAMSDVDFDASDTDHDGIGDLEEAFGKSVLCSQGPTPQLGLKPTGCSNISKHGCADPTQCTPRYQLPFSAMSANPGAYDVYVHYDTLGTEMQDQFVLLPDKTKRIYDSEGNQCPESFSPLHSQICPGERDWHYEVRLHLHKGSVVGAPVPELRWAWPVTFMSSHMKASMPSSRRLTDVFRYTVGVDRGAQAVLSSREFVYGRDASRDAVFVHELGHTLSLRHGGFEEQNRKLNYPPS